MGQWSTRGIVCILIVLFTMLSANAAPVDLTLDYSARAVAFAYANIGIIGDGNEFDTSTWDEFEETSSVDDQGLGTGLVSASTHAEAEFFSHWEPHPNPNEPDVPYYNRQWSDDSVSVKAEVLLAGGIKFSSSMLHTSGFGHWDSDIIGESPHGASWTAIQGTLDIGTDAGGGYSEDTPFFLEFSADIQGDDTIPTWDWWVKIWRDDPGVPISVLDANDISVSVEVFAGETLNYQLLHIPEPATIILTGTGLAFLAARRRKVKVPLS